MTRQKKPIPQITSGNRFHVGEDGRYYEILQILPATGVSAVFVDHPETKNADEITSSYPVIVWALVKREIAHDMKTVDVMGMIIQQESPSLVLAAACENFKEYSYDG